MKRDEWIEAVKEGIAAAERGELIAHEVVMADLNARLARRKAEAAAGSSPVEPKVRRRRRKRPGQD